MPRTRARAESCTIYDNAYAAAPATQPTHASILTGLQPWQHGVTRNGLALSSHIQTVTEVLHEAGFTTRAVVASFPLAARFGFDQGFDSYYDHFDRRLSASPRWEGSALPADRTFYSLGPEVTAAAISAVDGSADSAKQFFWFHFFDPHDPYGDTAGGRGIGLPQIRQGILSGRKVGDPELHLLRGLYEKDVQSLDVFIDQLFERFSADAADFDTQVIVTADHGESLGEDGSLGHGSRLVAAQLRVPLFICSPQLASGVRHDVTGSVDLAPTLLSLAGLEGSMGVGRDLTLPADANARAAGMRPLFASPLLDLRIDGSQPRIEGSLFFTVGSDGVLYRGNSKGLLPTPGTEVPATGEHVGSAEIGRLFQSFDQQLADLPADEPLDPEVEEGLRALGYVQ